MERQFEVKHLDLVSVMKVCFVLYAVFGILFGLIYVIVAAVLGGLLNYGGAFPETGFMRLAATGVGILLIPLLALLYGCLGALVGLVMALIYNLIARAIGGVKIRLEEVAASGGSPGGGNQT